MPTSRRCVASVVVYPSHCNLDTRLICGNGQSCGSTQLSQTTAI